MFSKDLLSGQNGIVTGGSSGIGFAIAQFLIQHGAQVTITGRSQEKLYQAQKDLQAFGNGSIHTTSGDVRKKNEIERGLKSHVDKFGPPDFLINNAAGNFLCPLEKLSENAFSSVIDIVTKGTFLWSNLAFPYFKEKGSGSIINIGTNYVFGHGAYVGHSGAAKSAVLNLTRTMAVEWGKLGVRANMICPGPIEGTEGVKRLLPEPNLLKQFLGVLPMQRMGKGEEIAQTVAFLLSPLASYINGAAIPVDGGMHLTIPGLLPHGPHLEKFFEEV